MRLRHFPIFLLLSLIILGSCGEDSEEIVPTKSKGDIYGTVTNEETGEPVVGANISVAGGESVQTNEDGRYEIKGVLFSDSIEIVIAAADYEKYKHTISLQQEILLLNVNLAPLQRPSAEILAILDALSKDVAALDPGKTAQIQSYFSEDYVAADNMETRFGIFAGVLPPDYEGIPEAVITVVGKYDKLEFTFANPGVKFDGDSAQVFMDFLVYAETKPPAPKKWDVALDARIDFQKENGDWKIIYWEIVSIVKFEEEPL